MYEQMTFSNERDFREWLDKNHDTCDGIWLVFGKTEELITLTYDEALRHALCYGWIDGQIKRIDDDVYKRKFTPRRKKSIWSERNKRIVAKLIKSNLMMPSGLFAIERAKKEGMWKVQKDSISPDEVIKILTKKLEGTEPAYSNYLNMSPSVKKTYSRHYLDAKKEATKARRLMKIIERLNENLKPM